MVASSPRPALPGAELPDWSNPGGRRWGPPTNLAGSIGLSPTPAVVGPIARVEVRYVGGPQRPYVGGPQRLPAHASPLGKEREPVTIHRWRVHLGGVCGLPGSCQTIPVL